MTTLTSHKDNVKPISGHILYPPFNNTNTIVIIFDNYTKLNDSK